MSSTRIQSYLELIAFGFHCALVLSYLLTPLAITFGFRFGFIDQPDERRLHTTPTPRCGGLAVFFAYSITLYFLSCFLGFPALSGQNAIWIQSVILVSIPLILLGLIDDRWEIKPIFKLLGQIVVGLLAWNQGLNLGKLLGMEVPLYIDAATTIFLYVAAMNAYNLIDGMDGVAAGLAAITSLGLGALNLLLGNEGMATMCFALTGATLGFLRYNFHPARVFLGDTGSMYIGFILMSLTLSAQSRSTAAIMLIIPVLTMGVPMIDTALAIWRRSVRRAMDPTTSSGVSKADKDHLHHRLARKGLTHRRVALTLYIIQAVLFSVGLLWVFLQNYRMAIFTIGFFAGSYVVLRYLASLEMNDSGRWIVDGIRRPGRMQLFNSLMPVVDIAALLFALLFLSWLVQDLFEGLGVGRLIRELAAPIVGGPMILIWATKFYRLQWTRARALDFFSLGFVITAGVLIGVAVSTLPLHYSMRTTLLFSLVLLSVSVPLMTFFRVFPRLVQDMLHYHDRKKNPTIDDKLHRVLVYGAGYGYTLITRAESFDDTARKRDYCLVGLIDDDPYLRGRLVHGHQVLGGIQDLSTLITSNRVDEIIVSTDLNPENETRLLDQAENFDIKVTRSIFSHSVLREKSTLPE